MSGGGFRGAFPINASGLWDVEDVYSDSYISPFLGGNIQSDSIFSFASRLAFSSETSSPSQGGSLQVNNQSLYSYDFNILKGSRTVSSYSNSDWFTSSSDKSAFIVVRGDLTINSGVTFTPSSRKLFTVLFVTGNLTIDGTISMTTRGANHVAFSANDIRLVDGTYSGVVNPSVPASGGSGGEAITAVNGNTNGVAGTNGSNGSCGGGGAGGARANLTGITATAGSGSQGTSFGGGTGGGGVWSRVTQQAFDGALNGGPGGGGAVSGGSGNDPTSFGGSGNPIGSSAGPLSQSGDSGTGGVLFVVTLGALLGTGSVTANGGSGGRYVGADTRGTSGGGGSGGGSVTVFCSRNLSSVSVSALGGSGGPSTGQCATGTCPGGSGGGGGNGTARILTL